MSGKEKTKLKDPNALLNTSIDVIKRKCQIIIDHMEEKGKGIDLRYWKGYADLVKKTATEFPDKLVDEQILCLAQRNREPKTYCIHIQGPCRRDCIQFIEENIKPIKWWRGTPINAELSVAYCSCFDMPIKF